MPSAENNWLATRTTLLGRLRDWEDESSWSRFFETYGPVIFAVALKSGLRPEDAEDVVQETIMTVARRIKEFEYDRGKGSFKSWLLTIGRSKIIDRWRKTQRQPPIASPATATDGETQWIDRAPDPAAIAPDERWETEWRENLMAAALLRLKQDANPRHFQVFDLLLNKEWEPSAVAEKLKINVDQVYVIKQRLTARLREEVEKLRLEWEGPGA